MLNQQVDLEIAEGESKNLSVHPKAADGSPAEGEASWALSDKSILKITPSKDGKTCAVKGLKKGFARVVCTLGDLKQEAVVEVSDKAVYAIRQKAAAERARFAALAKEGKTPPAQPVELNMSAGKEEASASDEEKEEKETKAPPAGMTRTATRKP